MNIIKLSDLSKEKRKQIMQRAAESYNDIMPTVQQIMNRIRTGGDSAIQAILTERTGRSMTIPVTKKEVQDAYSQISSETLQALKQMKSNITQVHRAQLPKKKDTVVSPISGIRVWREWRPIEKVGVYIPGGKAVYPSSVFMTVLPARIAGCSEIVLCTPSKTDGTIPAATLVAADMVGVKNIYKLGGAEAIGAMLYGTETIPQVYKLFGAGGPYTTAAKIVAQREVAIDMPAGPSEVMIIADETANSAFIAADLLADGEHAEDSACILLTTSKQIAAQTAKELEKQLADLPTRARAAESLKRYGLIAVASLKEIIVFANEYAPEHLQIMTRSPQSIAAQINNAGSIFLGEWTCKSSGDYATGANHVLPTGGMAKMYNPLGVDAYGKWMQLQTCTKTGLKNIRKTIETIAEVEELPAHKRSAQIRFTN